MSSKDIEDCHGGVCQFGNKCQDVECVKIHPWTWMRRYCEKGKNCPCHGRKSYEQPKPKGRTCPFYG